MGIMSEHIVGLDVGDDYVSLARVQRDASGALRLVNGASRKHAAGGDAAALAAEIRDLRKRSGCAGRTVATSLHSRSLLYRYCSLPGVSEPDEVASALRIEAEEALQLTNGEIVSDWCGRSVNGAHGASTEGILVAVAAADVDAHLALVKRAGFYPAILDARCMALANLYKACEPKVDEERVVCLTHVNSSSADTAILYGRDRLYARSVHFRADADTGERMQYLLGSLQDVLKYFRFKLHNRPVDELLLLGPAGSDHDLARRAGDACGVPASVWDPFAHIEVAVGRSHPVGSDLSSLALATGLALRGVPDA